MSEVEGNSDSDGPNNPAHCSISDTVAFVNAINDVANTQSLVQLEYISNSSESDWDDDDAYLTDITCLNSDDEEMDTND